ncbi:hypothetical protein AA12717_0963 [Gluconacetobacter sacchari DSM 12717]|uniref:Uncharacterized protein n=2 Tax=Gluconacetobacter sacchari TaxID=92759 RepID=A0A7W4IET5_9PROT|nr:hypothetical protein [Gluconacetobacter sacchari]MBB2161530.1 hypothetical protein [Gluconacetobacter sacchari]GBQ21662.1 hypothetical protein AA12717_0963 [Gluconacetobacter sacchari DSM 12717]
MADHRKTPTRLTDTFEAIALIGGGIAIALTAWLIVAAPAFLAGIPSDLDHRHPVQVAAR